MDCIRPLSEAVQSAVRSGFIIGSLTTVVEELIYNSLDAGATKVLVSVGVNNGYVKVEDDGYGISRDGLILLGERYATSKRHHLQKNDYLAGSYGFRGEVLCSIADVSLIEIVTRIHGRLNGYRKVMKGRKCLYLSIDDRQDAGTTVVVRDLFYNQPVRRRQIQCSAKKVLHSVRKSAVRIALAQPKVSFKVVDIESEDELLCTRASSSPLPLLCSNFGIEASSLHELSFSNGLLKLTGYVSAPSSSLSLKAIQYVYVNSRFVVKGPIHKALNRLADMCWGHLKGDKGGKRGQPHAGPTYCLNITCPRSFYDLNLEFSETSVEFKDWALVLTLIENSVAPLWSKNTNNGGSAGCIADQIGKDGVEKVVESMFSVEKDWWLKTCETSMKRRRTQNSEKEPACTKDSSFCMEMQVEETSDLSVRQGIYGHRKTRIKTVKLGEPEMEMESPHQIDLYGPVDVSRSSCTSSVKDSVGDGLQESDKGLLSLNEVLSENDFDILRRDDNHPDNCLFGSTWKDKVTAGDRDTRTSEVGSGCSFEGGQGNDRIRAKDDHKEDLLLQSPSRDNIPQSPLDCDTKSRLEIDNFNGKRRCSNYIGSGDVDGPIQDFDDFQRAQGQSKVLNSWPSPKLNAESHLWRDLDMNSMKYSSPLPSCRVSFDRHYTPEFLSDQLRLFSPSCSSANFDQHSAISFPFPSCKDWNHDHLVQDEGHQNLSEVRHSDDYDLIDDEREDLCLEDLDDRCLYKNLSSTSSLNSKLLLSSDSVGLQKGIWELSHHGCSDDDAASLKYVSRETCSPCIGRRQRDSSVCWDPLISINKGVQMDLRRCHDLGEDDIFSRMSGRNHSRFSPDSLFSPRCDDFLANETILPCMDRDSEINVYKPSVHCISSRSVGTSPIVDLPSCQAVESNFSSSKKFGMTTMRSTRSHSAPPIYRGKKRFLSVGDCMISANENPVLQVAPQVYTTERAELEHPLVAVKQPGEWPSFGNRFHQHDETSSAEDLLLWIERKVKGTSNITHVNTSSQDVNTQAGCLSTGYLKEAHDSENSLIKWREGRPDTTLEDIINYRNVGHRLTERKEENTILDIQSSMLHLAGDSLVPTSINRNCLESAKVLPQVDNKFIPVVAKGFVAVIDQHAADERIRLEEMRRKVFSGEMKSITYLEEEKDLVLPERAYQLLCNYAEHIQHWGWICNIFTQDSGSFAKNLNFLNEQTSHLRLLAVPCVLGVNLSDADLLEFLEQLADTDGSSTTPPSVVRVLNYKACRGAIMFGDKLLPSECSLIVEELKRTSLCFQCAHGRPTTVPLVYLKALHKGITQLESSHEGSENTWHGLCRKEINFVRAKHRLDVARGCG